MTEWNYLPVSLLLHISRVFERIILNQIKEYIEPFLSNLSTGLRKNQNEQHCLLRMLEKWKGALNKDNFVYAIFMGLSKAFENLNHDLLTNSQTGELFQGRTMILKELVLKELMCKFKIDKIAYLKP